MKSKKEISEYLYQSRKFHIDNKIFDVKLSYNYMGIIVRILIILLILSIGAFAYWLG